MSNLNKSKWLVKRMKNVTQVVRQCCFLQAKFADDGNSNPYVSSWSLSACGHNVAHLTGSTTRTRPPEDPKKLLNKIIVSPK